MKTFLLQVGNEAFIALCDDKEAAIKKFKLLARTQTISESQIVELTNAGVVSIYNNPDESDDYFLDFIAIN
jgi:hypothetical protein